MQYDQTRYDVSISAIPKQGLVGLRAGVEGQSRAGTVIGGQLPVMPDSLSTDMATALPIAGDEWLLRCADADTLHAQLDATLEGRHGVVAVVSDAWCGFRVRGEDALHVMAQVVAVDVQAFADRDIAVFGRTGVGRAAGLVVRNVRAQDFSIYVDVTHARYAQKLLHTCAGAEI